MLGLIYINCFFQRRALTFRKVSLFGLEGSSTRVITFALSSHTGHTSQSAFCQALAAIKADDHVHLELSGLTPEDGIFLLKMAAERGHTACLRVLLAAGKFDPSGSKVDGTTPLHLAAENAHIRSG